jgi:hypothetical protein
MTEMTVWVVVYAWGHKGENYTLPLSIGTSPPIERGFPIGGGPALDGPDLMVGHWGGIVLAVNPWIGRLT